MSSFISTLDEVIDSRFKISNSGGKIELIEKKENAQCRKVSIQTSKRVVAFSLDIELRNCQIFPFFNSHVATINKKADAIIFIELEEKLIVLLIDLKSDNPRSAYKQLLVSKNFAEYLIRQARLLNSSFKKDIFFKKIAFTTKLNKGTTSKNRNGNKINLYSCNQEYRLSQLYS